MESEGGKFSLYRHDWGLGRTGKKLNQAWKKVFDKGLDKATDKALHEIEGLGVGAKKKMGFTKAKFKKAMKKCMQEDMDEDEREKCAKEMEGGKFSLYRHDWGLGRTGAKLNKAWEKVFDKGLDKVTDKATHEIDGMGMEGGATTRSQARLTEAARKKKKKKAAAAQAAAEPAPAAPKKKKAARKAPKMDIDAEDPFYFSTIEVPAQSEKCAKLGRKLRKCAGNPARKAARAKAVEEYTDLVETVGGKGLSAGAGLCAGAGLYAGASMGRGLSAGAGLTAGMTGGSIGSRLSAPTNVGAGGNLLGPMAGAKAPQAGYANFHMFTQMPVALQPRGMFSSFPDSSIQ